ncbi:MAG: hypothetical protein NVS9B1_09990 [Candidatus Dormibacteraceae bacterium]
MSNDLPILGLKVLAGGTGVVLFSLIGQVLKPKSFAGVFAAAPAVALASLLVTTVAVSPAQAMLNARGMIIGAVGMVACCAVAAVGVRRLGAVWGSAVSWAAWALVVGTVYIVVAT